MNAGDGIIYADEKGIVREMNPAFSRITNIPREQLLGRQAITLANKFVKPKNLPYIIKSFKMVLKGESVEPYEIEFNNKFLEISSPFEKNDSGITAIVSST